MTPPTDANSQPEHQHSRWVLAAAFCKPRRIGAMRCFLFSSEILLLLAGSTRMSQAFVTRRTSLVASVPLQSVYNSHWHLPLSSTELGVLLGFGNSKERGQDFGTEYVPVDFASFANDPLNCDPDFPCVQDEETNKYDLQDFFMVIGIPLLTPFIAFFTYESVSHGYQSLVEFLSTKMWVAVDGGELQNKLLMPTINGLVVPAVALLFATLTSTTISTLRQRQVEIRKAINMEAGELRAIECLLDSIEHGPVQDQCREYLIQYTSRILAECHPRNGSGDDVINPRRSFDSELNGFIRHLNDGHGDVIPAHVADECYNSVARLREQRVNRITALQSVYPTLHYAILIALATAECVSFLMETDLEVLVFLNSFQLKTLWSMMVGTFVACFAVFLDLRNPFSGSYQISPSVDQLHTIMLTLQASRVLSNSKTLKEIETANGKKVVDKKMVESR